MCKSCFSISHQYLKRVRAINCLCRTTSRMEVVHKAFLKLRTLPSPTLLATDSLIFRSTLIKNFIFSMLKWIKTTMITYLVMELIIRKNKNRRQAKWLKICEALLDYVASVVLQAGKKRGAERWREKSGMHEQGIVNPRKRSKSVPADNVARVGSAVINAWISETAVLAWPMRLWSSGSRLCPSETIALTGPSRVGSGW